MQVKLPKGRIWGLLISLILIAFMNSSMFDYDVNFLSKKAPSVSPAKSVVPSEQGRAAVDLSIKKNSNATNLKTLSQTRAAYQIICSQYSDWIGHLERINGIHVDLRKLKVIDIKNCRDVDVRDGYRNILRDTKISPAAMVDPAVLAADFTAVLEDFDIARQALVFQGVKYAGGDYLAATYAFRILPCEFGWNCGSENFYVQISCLYDNLCFQNLQELVLAAAENSGIDKERVNELKDRFANQLRNSLQSSRLESPFGETYK